jgi:integrase
MIREAEQYLEMRRKLGYALSVPGRELLRFARYVDKTGHKGPLTVDIALKWALAVPSGPGLYAARRLEVVRQFARYMKLHVPETEIPPEGILGPSRRRVPPRIYSEQEMQTLIAACRRLPPVRSIRPHTHATLFGLLACTGMRVSEALHLSVDDVDVDRGVITIVEGKFHKSRVLPLHPSCTEALAAYRELRERRRPATGAFFVTHYGTPLTYSKALITFRGIARRLGWSRDTRIHGLRHTFAVRKLLQWHRDGEDVDRCIGQLSTYLGHCKVHHTYWYLSAVPELMDIAADRFERYAEVRHG